MNAKDHLVWRLETAVRPDIVILVVLDGIVDHNSLLAWHHRAAEMIPRMASRVHAPRTRWAHPRWEPAPHFNPARHVHRVSVPGRGTRHDLLTLAEALTQSPFVPGRPPWESYLVEGLEDGTCAYLLKISHCIADGLRLRELFLLAPYASLSLAQAGALGADGRCKFGDAFADGYVQAEAAGMVLLKPLRQALTDGDRVRAVILGGAVGNSGFTGQGMIAPTAAGQEEILRAAYRASGVDPRDVMYVEAHGPGTAAGDPAELTALARVLGPRENGRPRCLLGSAKTSVGHTEGAAGVVALIKTVLCLEQGTVPGNPYFTAPRPDIDWDSAPFEMPRHSVELKGGGARLLAGVTSFGASGTGAHLVLSTPPPRHRPTPGREARGASAVLALSARSRAALDSLTRSYAELLAAPDAPPLAEVCAAAAAYRDHYEYRLAVTARNSKDTSEALHRHLGGGESPQVSVSAEGCWSHPRLVFVFPGQGAQWADMGKSLLAADGEFAETLQQCDAVIRRHGGWSLLEALTTRDDGWLRRTSRIQPALWAMGVSLAALWRSWGIEPDLVMGHSQGEIAAAQVAGALTLEEAGRVSCIRARLIDDLALPGALCWIGLSHHKLPGLLRSLGARAELAVQESRTSSVVAGTPQDIDRIVESCEERGISCLPIPVTYAAHSPSVDPVEKPLLEQLASLRPQTAQVPLLSTVTATPLPGERLDAAYWWRNLREPVRLEPAVRSVLDDGRPTLFLQVSPHPVLTAALTGEGAQSLPSLRRDHDELTTLHRSLGALYVAGCDPDWSRVLGKPTLHVDLPHYPWQRSRYWHQSADFPWPALGADPMEASMTPTPTGTPPATSSITDSHPVLEDRETTLEGRRRWSGRLDRERHAFLLGHRVGDRPVAPAAFYAELALTAAHEMDPGSGLSDVDLRELLLLDDDGAWDLQCRVEALGEDGSRIEVATRSTPDGPWRVHATMRRTKAKPAPPSPVPSLDVLRQRCTTWQAGEHFYRARAPEGNDWQGPFHCMAEIFHGQQESLVKLRPTARGGYRVHPGVLDGCLQAALTTTQDTTGAGRGFVLLGVDRVHLHADLDVDELWVHARQLPTAADGELSAALTVMDADGRVLAEVHGVRGRRLQPTATMEPPVEEAYTSATAPLHTAAEGMFALRWRPLDPPGAARPGNWLLVGPGGPLEAAARQVLLATGCTVHALRAGKRFHRVGPGEFRADPTAEDDLARVLAEVSKHAPLTHILYFGALDSPTRAADASPREVQWTTTDLCSGLLPLARALEKAGLTTTPDLCVLTRGAQAVRDGDRVPAPWQAGLWAFSQTIRLEMPQCATVLLDLDDTADPTAEAHLLVPLLSASGEEDRLALRGEHAYAPRLTPAEPGGPQVGAVCLRTTGGIGGIHLAPLPDCPPPGHGEIAIQVSCIGLNYHDVLRVTGSSAGEEDNLIACECAGTVVRVGAGVTDFSVGDDVLAYTFTPPASYTVTPAACAAHRPHNLTPAQAAGVPVAHVSAYRGLIDMAQLQPGETVLIHSATGGMGMAALDIARRRGATVYATAGTESKRNLLLQLGAARVADSRSADFARQLAEPGKAPVDVVLNTLKGSEAREANFSLLTPIGRYVETARNEMHEERALPLSLLLPGRAFLPMDLVALRHHDPVALGVTLRTVTDLLARGELAPPRTRVFPAEKAGEAMSLMARAGHTGKLALAFPHSPSPTLSAPPQVRVRPDATYLVVGGLGGIGGLFTDWLLDQGARHLLLTGRSHVTADPHGDERAQRLARLSTHSQCQVTYAPVDVADESAMRKLLRERRRQQLPAVAGVVHSALALEPTPLVDMTDAIIDQTMHPKVAGGWTLHRLFPGKDLDFLLLFSSAVSLLSGLRLGGQLAAYAAANAFQDALAAHRRAAGLPATIVHWGYWDQTGMAHRISERSDRSVCPEGIHPLRPADAAELFPAVLASQEPVCCMPTDWPAYAQAAPQDAGAPILRELLATGGNVPAATPASERSVPSPQPPRPAQTAPISQTAEEARRPVPAAQRRAAPAPVLTAPAPPEPQSRTEKAAAPPDETPCPATATSAALESWLVAEVARVLGSPVGDVDPTRPLNRLGLDSLLAAEVTTRLRSERGHDVTVSRIIRARSLRSLAAELTSSTTADIS
ncbi:acyltransferase domain-containing protein [Embleya sp. NPDC127516]|uniref:acyltransferase domain-containing protein n=1 Tax=Embleya sp. NPDC127516 TaxID=3363990 RepID=UPI00381287D8